MSLKNVFVFVYVPLSCQNVTILNCICAKFVTRQVFSHYSTEGEMSVHLAKILNSSSLDLLCHKMLLKSCILYFKTCFKETLLMNYYYYYYYYYYYFEKACCIAQNSMWFEEVLISSAPKWQIKVNKKYSDTKKNALVRLLYCYIYL